MDSGERMERYFSGFVRVYAPVQLADWSALPGQ